jgi:hypothetical protein
MSLPQPNSDAIVVVTGASSGIGAELARGWRAVDIRYCSPHGAGNALLSFPMSFAQSTRSPWR